MPKLKTHSGAKKKFKTTGSGKILHRRPYSSHFLGKKSSARKRGYKKYYVLTDQNRKNMIKKLGGKQ